MAQGAHRPVGGSGAVALAAADRRARAGADEVPLGQLLGPRGVAPHHRCLHFEAALRLGAARRAGQGLRRPRQPHRCQGSRRSRRAGDRRGAGQGAGRRAGRSIVPGEERGGQAGSLVPAASLRDLDAAAGRRPQAEHERPAGDAGGPGPLRARLHHLHAHRLGQPVPDGARCRPRADQSAVRREVPARRGPPVRHQGSRRPGSARSGAPGR